MWNQTVLIDIFNPLIIYITLATLIWQFVFKIDDHFNSTHFVNYMVNCQIVDEWSCIPNYLVLYQHWVVGYSLFHVSIFLILCHAFGFSKTCISRWKSENTILSLEVSQQSLASMKNTIIIYLWSLFFSHFLPFVHASNFIQNRIM